MARSVFKRYTAIVAISTVILVMSGCNDIVPQSAQSKSSASSVEQQDSQSENHLDEKLSVESISDDKRSEIYDKVWPFVNAAIEKLEINQDGRSIGIANTGYVLINGENMFLVVVTDDRDRKNELLFNCAISQDFSRFFVEVDSTYKSLPDW